MSKTAALLAFALSLATVFGVTAGTMRSPQTIVSCDDLTAPCVALFDTSTAR